MCFKKTYKEIMCNAFTYGHLRAHRKLLTLLEVYYKKINIDFEIQRIAIHDMKNHLEVLQDLASNNDIVNVKKYITELIDYSFNCNEVHYCQNAVVNAVLLSKVELARKHNIQIITRINVPQEIPISLIHLSSIIEKALDNAIQTCVKMKSDALKKIIFSCDYQKSLILISIKSPYPVDTLLCIKKNHFISTKINKNPYCIGISGIYRSVKACHGTIDINMDGMTFELTILVACDD